MNDLKNKYVLLAKRPIDEPQREHFTIGTVPIRKKVKGEVLVIVPGLSLAPKCAAA
jgi:hypothetical protein